MPVIADLIARDRDAIMARWLDEAGRVASARGLDEPALANIMPRYLASLAIEEDGGIDYVEHHFSMRLRQGFELADIVEEFALLGRCIVEHSRAVSDEPLDGGEIDRLHARLQRASIAVAAMFDAHMRQDEQLDKRYARLLRDVATAALHAGVPALESGLRELLDLVRDAMDARGAAILLRDNDTHLVTAATAAAEPLAEYAMTTGASSLAAMSADSELARSRWDISSTELEVPETLVRSGIRALLGIRLRSPSGLIGLMYVGIAEPRAFTTRESRRLETLAEQLVAHVDAVVLMERLNTTIGALQAERSIREHFVSILAHDLRGPLSAAKLAAEMLARSPESLDARRDLAVRIDRNLDRLERMIRDLLDTNRIRAGERLPLRLDACDLEQLAQDVAEELRVVHGDRFVVEGERRAVMGTWSADELRRVLWNLGENAVKYGAPDRPITFVVQRLDDRARVSVHNWGEPIAAGDQLHLFEPFARTRTAIESGRPGWGLGLVLVRGCAEAHGGLASVTSTEAEGTTFTVELPIDARPYQLDVPTQPPGHAPCNGTTCGPSARPPRSATTGPPIK